MKVETQATKHRLELRAPKGLPAVLDIGDQRILQTSEKQAEKTRSCSKRISGKTGAGDMFNPVFAKADDDKRLQHWRDSLLDDSG
jgi:hypothetical protein